jgi:hypothetical protein
VGFGVTTPEDAAEISAIADGVIVGSAIVKQIAAGQQQQGMIARVSGFVQTLKGPWHVRVRKIRDPISSRVLVTTSALLVLGRHVGDHLFGEIVGHVLQIRTVEHIAARLFVASFPNRCAGRGIDEPQTESYPPDVVAFLADILPRVDPND